MNHLNSVVVEGNVKGSVNYTEQVLTSVFEIEVRREFKDGNGKVKTELFTFPIKATGNLALYVVKDAVNGRGMRVVGRLVNSGSQVMVFAESIEFKVLKEAK
jgi:hypothetical protein